MPGAEAKAAGVTEAMVVTTLPQHQILCHSGHPDRRYQN